MNALIHHVQFLHHIVYIKIYKSTGKSENVIIETVAEEYSFKVMHKCIRSLCAMVKVHECI